MIETSQSGPGRISYKPTAAVDVRLEFCITLDVELPLLSTRNLQHTPAGAWIFRLLSAGILTIYTGSASWTCRDRMHFLQQRVACPR